MRRVLAAMFLTLLLAGCASPPAPQPPPDVLAVEGLNVVPANFTHLDSPWLLRTSSGCGTCSGQGGYAVPAEHHAFLVLQDLRVARVEFTVRPGGVGFHVFPNVTLPAAELAPLLTDLARGRDGEVWVSRVWLGKVEGPGAAHLGATLAARWSAPNATPCRDCGGVDVWLNASGDARHAVVQGELHPGDPFLGVLGVTGALELRTLDVGTVQGATAADPERPVEGRSLRPSILPGCVPIAGPAGSELLRDAARFHAAWRARCGNTTAPDVDFSNTTVVSAWWGHQPSTSYALGVISATQEQDHARVVLLRITPGPGCPQQDQGSEPGGFTAIDGTWEQARYESYDQVSPPC